MEKQKINRKYDDVMMETTSIWAKKSKCKKRKVAAVIAEDNVIISIGINGIPKGYERTLVEEIKCEKCNGTGKLENNEECNNCSGKGFIITEIPARFECEDEIKVCPKCKKEYKNGLYENKKVNFCIECGEDLRKVKSFLRTDHDITLHAEQNALINAARLGHKTEDATMYISTAPCSRCALLIAQAGIKRVVYGEEYKNKEGIQILISLGIKIEQYESFRLITS